MLRLFYKTSQSLLVIIIELILFIRFETLRKYIFSSKLDTI